MKPGKRIELTNRLNPEAVDLARWVCLATRIEPALVRRARLRLLPSADAGTESDLWFSPLVQTVGARYILFYPDVSNLLRRQLAASRKDFARAWRVTRQAHRSLPELMRLEEKLTWLALKDDARVEDKLDTLIRPIIKAILTGQREGLGRWALNIIPNLPERARTSKSARLLRVIAESQLYGGWANLLTTVGDGPTDEEAALLLHGLERTTAGLRLQGTTLEVSEPPEEGTRLIDVPATNPRVLELSWIDNFKTVSSRLMWRSGEPGRAGSVTLPLSVNTLAGDSHQLTYGNRLIDAHRKLAEQYVVSILDRESKPVGLGVLVENDFILTSLHSIRPNSLNRLGNQPIQFLLLERKTIALASRAGSGIPSESTISGDEAMSPDYPMLFRLHASQDETRPAKLTSAFDLKGRVLLAMGRSPDGEVDNWAAFKVGEKTETGDFELIPATQISADKLSLWSGAPLVDGSTGEVAGLVLVNKGENARARLASLDRISLEFPEIFNAGSRIAIAYTRNDIKYVNEFKSRFEALELGDKLVFWEGWNDDIPREMDSVSVVLLFVSRSYGRSDLMLNDKFSKLLRQAEERGVVILPVILEDSAFTGLPGLARYQAFNDRRKPLAMLLKRERDQVFQRLSEILAKQLGVAVDEGVRSRPEATIDFFISYHQADRRWAEWIAWRLEEAGYSTFSEFQDPMLGERVSERLRRTMNESARTVAILTPDYLVSKFTRVEWNAALAGDRTGEQPRLLPVRVREAELPGVWSSRIYIDLVGLSEEEASSKLIKGIKDLHPNPVRLDRPQKRSIERVPFPVSVPEPIPERRQTRPIPRLTIDLFISYAQIDNTPFNDEKGWVDQFVEGLRVGLSQMLGFDVTMWYDTKFQGDKDLMRHIRDQLYDSYLFLAIVTPGYLNSLWCREELETFYQHATQTSGLMIDRRSRIFVVQKRPVEAVPDELSDLLRYEFYDLDPQVGRPRDLSPQRGTNRDERYWKKLQDLSWDIKETLETIRKASNA